MSIFDRLRKPPVVVPKAAPVEYRTERFSVSALPESLIQMQALPEVSLDTPCKTAAPKVCALCAYAADRIIGTEMLDWPPNP